MTTVLWIVIGVLVLIIIALIIAVNIFARLGMGFINAFSVGLGGPDLMKKRKR
jgi:hypothetical protein